MRYKTQCAVGFALALGLTSMANADILFFSGEMSDGNLDPANYSARVEWDYLELDHVLAITIYNDTADFTISNLRFNTSNDVWLMFLPFSPWSPFYNSAFPQAALNFISGPTGGFGYFDWDLDLAWSNNGLDPGESATIYMYALGQNLNNDDFFSHLSWNCDEGQLAALRFTNEWYDHYWRCFRDSSTWGAPGTPPTPPPPITVVPEPASMALLGLGLAAAALHHARR